MSHQDFDHKLSPELGKLFTSAPPADEGDFFKRLIARSEQLTEQKANTIAAGNLHGEPVLEEATVDDVLLRRLPDDPLALRISVGGPDSREDAYCVYRGDRAAVIALLERVLCALRSFP